MSLGDAYTMGVKVTGDIASLRAELAAGTQVINTFASTSTAAMTQAASAMDRAAAAMEKAAARSSTAGDRTAKAVEKPKRPLVSAAQGFDDYMRRATKAQEQVASTSESTSNRTTRSLDNVGSTLTKLTGGLGFALLAKQVWDTGLGFATFTQNTQIALSSLLGSGEAAKSFLAEILAFAKTTPYAFTDLTDQAQKLITWGFDAQQVVPILRSIGDAATTMGKGKEGIDRVVLALGQINTKGRLQAQELLQLSEVGVNGLKILANQAGMSTLEFQKLITAGLVPADEAIAGIVKGLNEGTTGVNGTTVAFGGMMDKIKGSGGITATVDSANTAFRNMSGALVQGLLPSYLSVVRVVTSGMGTIRSLADLVQLIPQPVRDAALALTALTVANRALNTQARASAVWSSLRATWTASAASAEQMGQKVTRTRTALIAARSAAAGVGPALLGAFGGPVGLAITGVAVAATAFASAQQQARQRTEELIGTLDELGNVTDQTRKQVADTLSTADTKSVLFFDFKWRDSAFDAAEKLGIDLDLVTDAAMGSVDALEKLQPMLKGPGVGTPELDAALKRTGLELGDYATAQNTLEKAVAGTSGSLEEAIRVARQKAAADGTSTAAMTAVGNAYSDAASKVREFTEDEQKAIAAAGDAAFKAAQTNLGARSLNLATEDDIASAREKVADATDKVADAEADRADKAGRRKTSARDLVQADEAVADAHKALREATDDLAKTEDRADPVKQYKEQVQGIIDASQQFARDIQALADKGLNNTDLASIIAAGPEGSADTRKALLTDESLIGWTNEARSTIDDTADTIQKQAEIVQIALQDAGAGVWDPVGLGMRIAAEEGAVDTVTALAAKLGEDPQGLYDVGNQLGLSFLAGLSDASKFDGSILNWLRPSETPWNGVQKPSGYYTGGIYPGYTPGRDTGLIAVGGGEAIMRPEWTRAVGPGYVHQMNAIARTAGVGGVQAAMRRFLGGFAGGGIAGSPQVVTVPVSSTHERYSPVTVQRAYVVDAGSLGIYGDRTTPQRRKFGGTRG